jgi:type IV secretory pathway VirB2 component (pilin)
MPRLRLVLTTTFLFLAASFPASATYTNGLPWDSGLADFLTKFQGGTAVIVALLAGIVSIVLWITGEGRAAVKGMARVAAGIALVSTLATVLSSLGITAASL